jgi:exodeoxyribonuclease VII large subunit
MLNSENDKEDYQLTLPLEPQQEAADWRANVPTVAELTRRVRGHLEGSFMDVWVRGEVSNFRRPASGHVYFILKDATAQLKAVMFKVSIQKLKFQLQDGMEILLHGRLSVYEARGEYQLVCDTLEPVGVGALQLAFNQMKARLQAEGLFEAARKKKLPFLPRRIGVVTSSTGAAVRDILKVLSRRFPNREVVILHALVQGEKAAPEIVAALKRAERWNQEHPERALEVLIVGRGGGSLEDLWCFNEEIVARALVACPIPTISAVGHEIDFTIADFVADVRAPTPSAAAEMVIPRYEELSYQVQTRLDRMTALTRKRLEQLRMHLDHLSARLVDPREKVKLLKEAFRQARARLQLAMGTRVLLARKRLESGAQRLDLLSPLRVIARGFTLTTDPQGKIVRSVDELRPGDRLVTRVVDGTVEAQVLTTHKAIA